MSNFALDFHKPELGKLFNARSRSTQTIIKALDNRNENPFLSRTLTNRSDWEEERPFSKVDFSQLCDRLAQGAKGLLSDFKVKVQNYECTRPLAIGLGTPSFYETGIQLHHIYGFPYIPASSIKGAMRHWTIYRYFDNTEEKALKDDYFKYLFGSGSDDKEEKGQRSNLIFWDAYPTREPKLKVDLLNTHFPKYYGNKEGLPTDDQSPNPVNFLTVKSDSTFQFIIGVRKAKRPKGFAKEFEDLDPFLKGKNPTMLHIADYLLEGCLRDWGIGAKTALNYGRLQKMKTP